MDEPHKTSFFPVPVRWFEVPMDGMKRGFSHLKKVVDQLNQLDQIRSFPADTEPESALPTERDEIDPPRRPSTSVGNHLNTWA